MEAPPNKQNNHKPVIVAGKMRGALKTRVGSTAIRKSFLAVVASSALLGARRWQPTRSVGEERRGSLPVMLRRISVEAHPAASRDKHVEAAFLVISWASAACAVRRHLLFNNALSQARHAQFWPSLDPSQTDLGADLREATQMLLDIRSLSKPTFSPMSSSKWSVIPCVSDLSTKTNPQSCCCFTSFVRGAKRTTHSLLPALGTRSGATLASPAWALRRRTSWLVSGKHAATQILLESKSLWKLSRVFMSSSMQSMIWKVSGLSTKTNLQTCCCFTSFSRGATCTLDCRSDSTVTCATPCLSPRSGSFSGVEGTGHPSWLRTPGVTGADTARSQFCWQH